MNAGHTVSALVVSAVVLGVAAALLLGTSPYPTRRRSWVIAMMTSWVRGGTAAVGGRRGRRVTPDLTRDSAMLLRQLSALLQSGRSHGQVWGDLHRQWEARGGHRFLELCARAASAEQAGQGAAQGLDRFARELRTEKARRPPHRQRLGRQADTSTLLDVTQKLAGLLKLAEETGAPLSRLAEELAAAFDDDAEVRAAVSSAVAGPQLTQIILAALPVGGVLVGQMIGADALALLFGTGLGLLCLTAGISLLLVGLGWSRGMIRSVARDG